MSSLARFILLGFWWLGSWLPALSQPVIQIRNDRDVLNAGTSLLYFVDEGGTRSIGEVVREEGKFLRSEQQIPSIGITNAAYWGRFTISNEMSQECYLEISNAALEHISLYEVIRDDSVVVRNTGSRVNFEDREFRNNNYLLKLCGRTTIPRTFYLRVQHSRGTQFPIYVGTLKGLSEKYHREDFIMGIYFGFMILMILYNLFVYFSVRDPAYLYYVLYVAFMALLNASLSGYAFEYFWANQAYLNPYEDLLTASLSFTGTLFAMNFLRTKQNATLAHKAFTVFLVLYFMSIFIVLSGRFMFATIFLEVISLFLILVQFYAAFTVIRKGYKPAKFFLAAWSVLLLGIVVFIFKDFNILPYNTATVNSLKIGSAMEALLLSFALANRINIYKEEKDVAQQQTLDSLRENERLITNQKEMLETEVKKRTHELVVEKQKSEELLLNILPQETADELKRTGTTKVRSFANVTVMFTDFEGFTSIAEKLTAEELITEINQCFSAFDRIIMKHNVEKIKTIGDSYMCAGGLPEPNSTHASDVVQAALEMQTFMQDHRQKMGARYQLHFDMRLGIHTGPVVAGVVGTKKFAYDIWGDAVNTASRMESSGEPGKVNISGDTLAAIKGKFRTTYRGKIEAKNKGTIDMYFVDGPATGLA